ncbi:MAG TPA: NAD(P)H-dependent glycerol-3-phosphate dehydrogenase, partial [Xanthobacteraceae bacterium]|nr:NAD(P)H-dependent glycerol-3-phosphate dehydrogenase [Xanthobacteraceae bacterium]
EIGGAAKNVLAIGAGIVEGRGLGHSAAAALTTRGFAELMRFGRTQGARPETVMGLSGLGDLVLSCASTASRNFAFGVNIGQGRALKDIQHVTGLAEGAFTASVLAEIAQAAKVDMPITAAVAAVVAEKMSVDEAIDALLTRPLRAE